MKTILHFSLILMLSLVCSCDVMIDGPTKHGSSQYSNDQNSIDQNSTDQHSTDQHSTDQNSSRVISKRIAGFFPFEDNSNRWYYTESGGNTVTILVTDTISDDGITYFRVSFRENRVDTTDDWFSRSTEGVYFGKSLTGEYDLFLPAVLNSISGVFESAGLTVTYDYYDSLEINGFIFRNVLSLHYNHPIIHGFNEIILVDSIGIVKLVDNSGRWPINYAIDSCSINGTLRKF